MRSDEITRGVERAPHRTLLYSCGVTKEEFSKPFIGIASSYTDIIPGHIHMRDLERFIEKGVHAAGGYPFIFCVAGVCDGIAMGHRGMKYSLATRELIADMIEAVTEASGFDGLVLLTNCDKITPGMLMAAGRMDLPTVVVTAGPMQSGWHRGRRLSIIRDAFEAVGQRQRGEIDDAELEALEQSACPGPGACAGLYTANTMAVLAEAMGMSLVGCGTGLAGSSLKRRIAFNSGKRVVELVTANVPARHFMSREAFENAVRLDVALGGSTNTTLHLPAVAREAGVPFDLDLFDTLGTLIGVSEQAGFIKDSKLPRVQRALISDAVGTVAGAAMGTSTVTSFIESAAGVEQGGRTGLTAVAVGVLFLLALFFSPIIAMVGSYPPITAPALVVVGSLMMRNVTKIDWSDYTEVMPAFLIIIGIPLTYSIADGLALGFIAYPIIKLIAGQGREVKWLMYLMALVLVAYFLFVRVQVG